MTAEEYLKQNYKTKQNKHLFNEPDLPLNTSLERIYKWMEEYAEQKVKEFAKWYNKEYPEDQIEWITKDDIDKFLNQQ